MSNTFFDNLKKISLKSTNSLLKNFKLEIILFLRRIFIFSFRISHHQGNKKNIVLITTRRGGGTYLSEFIKSSEKSMRIYHHIFSWYQNDFYTKNFFKVKKNNQEIFPNSNNLNFFNKVNTGRLIAFTDCNFLNPNFVRKSNRAIYKITEAKGLFEWFINNPELITLFQVRHPIPTSISILNNGWENTIDSYLNNKRFANIFLNEDKYDYCLKIIDENDSLSIFVLNWVLENLIPLKSKLLKNILLIPYEDFILNPKKYIFLLEKTLSIKFNMDPNFFSRQPSSTKKYSRKSKNEAIKSNDITFLIGDWKKHIDNSYEKKLMSILEKFEIDMYQYPNLSINPKYLIH